MHISKKNYFIIFLNKFPEVTKPQEVLWRSTAICISDFDVDPCHKERIK